MKRQPQRSTMLREREFVQELLKTKSVPDAYMKIGKVKNRKIASQSGSRMLSRPRVREILAPLMSMDDINEERIAQEIARIAFANVPTPPTHAEKIASLKLLASLDACSAIRPMGRATP